MEILLKAMLDLAEYAGRAAAHPTTPEHHRDAWAKRAALASRVAKSGATDIEAMIELKELVNQDTR